MKIDLPSDCGNAPRIGIVSDFVTSWAKGDSEATSSWFADDAQWTVVGSGTFDAADADPATQAPASSTRLEVTSVITHGRLASCEGHLQAGKTRLHFSHVFRFASTAKTAKIAELRSYYIESRGD